jgi:hypothetical protein
MGKSKSLDVDRADDLARALLGFFPICLLRRLIGGYFGRYFLRTLDWSRFFRS